MTIEEMKKMTIEEMKQKFINNELEKDILAYRKENKEDVVVVIGTDFISTETFQKNGWVRKNIYTYDKDNDIWIDEEIYDGKWRE